MQGLKGKIIIVTGGSGLLGKKIIEYLDKKGAICINFDLKKNSEKSKFVFCDITSKDSVDQAFQQVLNVYSVVDGLVNNAYPRTDDWGKKFEDIELGSWKQNVEWQLNSYFYLAQQVSRYMIIEKAGSIVNIASIYGVVAPDFGVYTGTNMTMPAAYSAIKGGVISLSRYLCSYLGKYNIRVNSVSPGGVFDGQNSNFVDQYVSKVPLGRMCKTEDIVPLISFLLSDESCYISGQNICVDGGWTSI